MPEFETYIDIDPSEYLYSCSDREIKELIDCLIEDGHIQSKYVASKNNEQKNILDIEWDEIINKLSLNRLSLTIDEEEIIKKISKRF